MPLLSRKKLSEGKSKMRIFAIGLGGAGCRIADMLYGQDRQFKNIACVEAIAIDRDPATLNHLSYIPAGKRVYFPSVSLHTDDITDDITTDEIISLLHNLDTGDKDAIILCTGAGGTMAGVGVAILEKVRSTVVEPVFCLVTLPSLDEGRRVSAKAALDIDRLLPLVDGIILFDNGKLSGYGVTEGIVNRNAKNQKLNPLSKKGPDEFRQNNYKNLNAGIARRLGLLLRAGELSEGGDIETGEVVLDAGEILNTIRGMGFIAVGYAAADIAGEKFHIGSLFRPSGTHAESGHKKAERLVDLAKEAIYENISVPCDLTSAEKALILVAGPSQAISMKGFMTVRKWIDRSIAGMEMRSGDYPVKNTRYIAVIIILAGLSNIPRINEIRAFRDTYTAENPGWESDWHAQAPDHNRSTPKAAIGIQSAISGTISAGQENLEVFLRTRIPIQTQQKSDPKKPEEDRGPTRSIPFFSRHRNRTTDQPGITGAPDSGVSNDETKTVQVIMKTLPDNEEQLSAVLEIPESPHAPGNEGIISGDKPGNKHDTTIAAGMEPLSPVKDTMKTDLASVVAKAREDLRKMDEKR